jgi:hypothetical protein
LFIPDPDPDFLPNPDPGVKNGTGSRIRIRNTDFAFSVLSLNYFLFIYFFVEGSSGHKVSYAYFVAFISLLRNMELIKKVYLNATNGSRTAELTKVCLATVLALFLKGSELQCCGLGSGIRCLSDSWVRGLF